MALAFIDTFKKNLSKMATVATGAVRPPEWISSGNYALNRAWTGDFEHGLPMSRMIAVVGPSGSGKSFLSANFMRYAQELGYVILVLDTENALDIDYLTKIGVDASEDNEDFIYTRPMTIEDVNRICGDFFTNYIKAYGRDNYEAPKVLIVLDSLAGLSSTTELENYEKDGTTKADQGILAKRKKQMLRMITQQISRLPIGCIITDHVYNQDIMLGDGQWAITNSVKFFPSIIGLVTRLNLKDGSDIVGIRMRVETYKSRFTKKGTKIELELPYDKGLSPFVGLVEMLEAMGVVRASTTPGKKQGWKVSDIDGEEFFFRPDSITHEDVKKLLTHPLSKPVMGGGDEDPDPTIDIDDEV